VADRLERLDPARRELAPVRARFNLLAAAAGLKPEADLWPHLVGVTACALCDPGVHGRARGYLVILHSDTASSAERWAGDLVPRLGKLANGKRRNSTNVVETNVPAQAGTGENPRASAGPFLRLGTIAGRALFVHRRDCDVLIAWGDQRLIASQLQERAPGPSIAALCSGWAQERKSAPCRLIAFWPARLQSALTGAGPESPARRVLAEDPPVIWWGWTDAAGACDIVFWNDLRHRVHRFLDALPLDPPPYR
jgi:hypothetical protein